MSDWNPEKYLLFKSQRTQPALDLAKRISNAGFRTAADIGCGPGNSTAVLRQALPQARILGIDSSAAMIEKARREHPDLEFALGDARHLQGSFDLLFSNACLQWVEDHETLLPELMAHLNPGGCLAVQVPRNQDEPLFRVIRQTVESGRWDFSAVCFEKNDILAPEAYYDILSRCATRFDLWETVYYHPMPSHAALLDWVRGARLRPYLDALPEQEKPLFEQEILNRAREVYPFTESGEVILKFRRFFFTAWK